MEVIKKLEGNVLNVKVIGRLDTTTAPILEQELANELKSGIKVVFDFAELEYLSSAGLRCLLNAYKLTEDVTINNSNDVIKDVIELTALSDFFKLN